MISSTISKVVNKIYVLDAAITTFGINLLITFWTALINIALLPCLINP